MTYDLIKNVINLVEEFENHNAQVKNYSNNIDGFKHWIIEAYEQDEILKEEPDWEGKEQGRSPESVINTFIVHMNRYARNYSRAVIHDSDFSTQEDFIYLINLNAFGAMTKMELIKKNVQDKSSGNQIINRLIKLGFVDQKDSKVDKRSKIIDITEKGSEHLEQHMDKVRQATSIVTGNLIYHEKMQLIRLLTKLNEFHHPIYSKNIDPSELLEVVMEDYNNSSK